MRYDDAAVGILFLERDAVDNMNMSSEHLPAKGSLFSESRLIASLACELVEMRTLFAALPPPHRAWISADGLLPEPLGRTWTKLSSFLNLLTEHLSLPHIEIGVGKPRRGASIFESVLGQRILAVLPALSDESSSEHALDPASLARIAAAARLHSFAGCFPPRDVTSAEGVSLRTYASRGSRASAVLLVPPCGMPAPLLKSWMQFWSHDHFVMTWESRGLFPPQLPFDAAQASVDLQVEDLVQVLDSYGVERAHVMGSCGGAVIALAAAAQRPERVSSLSLWHGAFHLGGDAAKTEHERNLAALLQLAAADRKGASAIRSLLCQRSSTSVPAEIALQVLYPFANDELMHRYALLNGALLMKDVRPLLSSVTQPSLVVTSERDTTAHPEASHRVAERLPHALLHVEPEGDHLSHFRAEARAIRIAASFLSSRTPSAAPHPSLLQEHC